jgi:hypothetical protein
MRLKKRKDKTYATKKKLSKQGMLPDDYADDDEWRGVEPQRQLQRSLAPRRTRSKTRKAKNKDEVIEILDSSSEEESSDEEEVLSPKRNESNQFVEVSCCGIADWTRFVNTLFLSQLASYPFLSSRVQQSLPSQVT